MLYIWIIGLASLCLALGAGAAGACYYRLTRRVEGKYFDASGVRIHYTDEGTGVPVVLVHGFAVNADLNWRQPGITQALAREFRVIAMDQRGHGLSDRPHGRVQYGMQTVRDVVRLLDHLHIERAHVVGYSLGGFVTLKLAATHPERLLTAAPLGAGWENPDHSTFRQALPPLAAALEAGRGIGPVSAHLGMDRDKPGLLHTLFIRLLTRYIADRQALAGALRGMLDIGVTEDELKQIQFPVCSIIGGRDPLLHGVRAMDGLLPDHTVVIVEGANHIQTPRHPELLGTLRRFLRGHSDLES